MTMAKALLKTIRKLLSGTGLLLSKVMQVLKSILARCMPMAKALSKTMYMHTCGGTLRQLVAMNKPDATKPS